MLLSVFAAGVAVLLQSVPVQTVASSRPRATTPDSLRALRTARRAQETFEFVRRNNLPREVGVGSHHCDVRVGRWCVWNDESNDREPPPEAPRIKEARAKLLGLLDTLGTRFPGDEWIAAQRVRYLIEAKRYGDAVRVADRCSANGSRYLCRAYAGVALHDSGAVAAADSTFEIALAAMPESVRCEWNDISTLLDDEIGKRYERADCAARRRIETSFWRLTTPLFLRDHDFHNEYLARVARTEMQRDSRTPMGSSAEDAYRETALRYGYDTWYVRDEPPPGSMGEIPVAGYRAGGSGFNFVPAYETFITPATLRPDDWDLRLRTARALYGPTYARHFKPLARSQISLFRRGDSALVVAAYDVSDDTTLSRHPLEVGLYALRVDSATVGEPVGTSATAAGSRGIVMATAPWTPMVVSLELLDSTAKTAARTRFGIRPPASEGRVGISDLVMFGPKSADSLPHRLEDALALSLHSDHVGRDRLLGLFWETYGVRANGENVAVSISIERVREGWMRRTAERLRLATPFSPMKLQWTEVPDHRDGIASRSVTLNLAALQPGRYEITLTVTSTDSPPVVAKREVTLDR